jgi:hypothetical protein
MLRTLALVSVLPMLLLATPASAVTSKEKMETCKFGSDSQKLAGAKRKAFIARCMANRNDARGPVKPPAAKKPAAKKPVAKKPAAATPAPAKPADGSQPAPKSD